MGRDGDVVPGAIGSEGERLALEAGRLTEIPVGFDSEFNTATFGSDGLDDAELEGVVFDALRGEIDQTGARTCAWPSNRAQPAGGRAAS